MAQNEKIPELEAYFSALIVNDIEQSLDWYSGILGFEIHNKTVDKDRGFKLANLKRENNSLELIELDAAQDPKKAIPNYHKKTRLVGIFKFGYKTSHFDSWISHLQKNKVKWQGQVVTDPVSGKRMLIILDPDGNRVQLFEN